jgi:hypothetical protein
VVAEVQATAGLDGPVTEVRLQRGVRLAVRVVDRAGLVASSKERDELSAALPGALVTAALADAQGCTRYLPFTRSDGCCTSIRFWPRRRESSHSQ